MSNALEKSTSTTKEGPLLRWSCQRVVLNGQTSNWADINAGVPQGSVLGPLLFLIYINDLPHGLKSNLKLFADDTSIFSIVNDTNVSCKELNEDLYRINKWAHQWKMSFNSDPNKSATEVIFSRKSVQFPHPAIYFNIYLFINEYFYRIKTLQQYTQIYIYIPLLSMCVLK